MNTATPPLLPVAQARRHPIPLAWVGAIASLGAGPWKWAALIGIFGTTLQCALMFGERETSIPGAVLVPVAASVAVSWAVQVTLGLCAWAIVDRSGLTPERRAWQLAVALVAAALLQTVIEPALSSILVGHVDPCILHECSEKDWSKVPWWLMSIEGSGHMLILGGLIFAWLEVQHRNRDIEQRLMVSQQQRAQLQRSAFDARLTAMRAQVDPQFLFDSLADVQAAYAADSGRGAALLDRLIVYLRTALPRLRTEGSTVGAEADLVAAWLAVVAARGSGEPACHIDVDPPCAAAPFPATVLLPLVQWALSDPQRPAREVRLGVRRPAPQERTLVAVLRLLPGRACGDEEPAPRRIRERLQALYGDAAGLSCCREGPDGAAGADPAGATLITLYWPDESADRNRR